VLSEYPLSRIALLLLCHLAMILFGLAPEDVDVGVEAMMEGEGVGI